MSLVFNDTTTGKGIVQLYEKEAGYNTGDVSGNATRLLGFTADANIALDDFFALALPASGKWQLDDSNHEEDYPIIRTQINSGQRDYTFLEDETGNLVLDIYKVVVYDSNGNGKEIYAVDTQSKETYYGDDIQNFYNGQNAQGVPRAYDKTGNGIRFDLIPNYTRAAALEVYVNREASYFVSTDTTKKPGIPGLFHKYVALKPAYNHARRNSLKNLPELEKEIMRLEGDESIGKIGAIQRYFGRRERDVIKRMSAGRDSNK